MCGYGMSSRFPDACREIVTGDRMWDAIPVHDEPAVQDSLGMCIAVSIIESYWRNDRPKRRTRVVPSIKGNSE